MVTWEGRIESGKNMSEIERLAALNKTKLLDTAAEARFDGLTRIASKALGTEVALVSLIDENRQWFKSKVGTEESETPRDIAFCHHAIQKPGIMVVKDATKDERFKDNPLVTGGPNIAFYAGAPLITRDGHALGTLCVIDSKPRPDFDDDDKQILADLAASVMTEIEVGAQEQKIDDLSVVNEELQHRMGNMYAHVSSLVSLMDRSIDNKEDFAKNLRARINTLAQTQALIAEHRYESVSISKIIETTLSPFMTENLSKRITVQSTDGFDLSQRAAFTVTLMINELATNAIKHGALSTEDGVINISWTHSDRFDFQWRENVFGLKFDGSSGDGFGSQILKRIVPLEFRGQANFDISESGLLYQLIAERNNIVHLPPETLAFVQ